MLAHLIQAFLCIEPSKRMGNDQKRWFFIVKSSWWPFWHFLGWKWIESGWRKIVFSFHKLARICAVCRPQKWNLAGNGGIILYQNKFNECGEDSHSFISTIFWPSSLLYFLLWKNSGREGTVAKGDWGGNGRRSKLREGRSAIELMCRNQCIKKYFLNWS